MKKGFEIYGYEFDEADFLANSHLINPHPCDIAENIGNREAKSSSPAAIYAVYNTELDLVKIHQVVRERFVALYGSIGLLKIRKREIEKKIKNVFEIDRKILNREIQELEEKIDILNNGSAWFKYALEAERLIKRYLKLLGTSLDLIDNTDKHQTPMAEPNNKKNKKTKPQNIEIVNDRCTVYQNREKLLIIYDFVNLAKKFIEINAFMQPMDVSTCVCGEKKTIRDDQVVPENGMRTCVCGIETIGTAQNSTYKDSTRVDLGKRNSYEDLINFTKRIDAFEGNQKSKPPDALYKQLREHFLTDSKYPNIDDVLKAPLNSRGKKDGTSVELIVDALLATNNTAYYKDIELIGNRLWGWSLPNLTSSGLRDILISDYIATQAVYYKIKKRESSLNINLRLYYHLKVRGHDCDISDFKALSSQRSLLYHNRCFALMSKQANLKVVQIPIKNQSLKTGGLRTGDTFAVGEDFEDSNDELFVLPPLPPDLNTSDMTLP